MSGTKGSIARIPNTERVFEIIKEHGPILPGDIAFRFRRKRAKGKDEFIRAVTTSIDELYKQEKIIPTKVNGKDVYWTAI